MLTAQQLDWTDMPIHQAIKADWSSPEILIEGSLNSAKTTVALDKEIDALMKWPRIPVLLFRWTEDAVATKLRPAFETILHLRNVEWTWDREQKCYYFPNESIAYAFGLKASSAVERMSKIRGLGVRRICGDQVEECDRGVAGELRGRLRPDLQSTLRGLSFPFQLTFVANPSDPGFWLSQEFPLTNRIKGRKVYSLSVFDNRHLPQESIDALLRSYPESHPKWQTMIMGRRGLNIIGDPVYSGLFDKDSHVRPIAWRPDAPLLEGYHVGTHNPCWVVAQRTYHGGLMVLGGIIGRRLPLEDFLPLVRRHREEWFPNARTVQAATAPLGETYATAAARFTLLNIMRDSQTPVSWRESANAPDVQLAMIELLTSYLRRRTFGREEAFTLNDDPTRWLEASIEDGMEQRPFLAWGFEGGFVWEDHPVNVANATIRQPRNDDWYFNSMRCLDHIILNFCAQQPSEHDLEIRRLDEDARTMARLSSQRRSPWS